MKILCYHFRSVCNCCVIVSQQIFFILHRENCFTVNACMVLINLSASSLILKKSSHNLMYKEVILLLFL